MRMQENRVSFDNHQERINKILNNLEDIKKKDSEIVGELRSSMKTFVDETTPESEFTFNEASDYFTARRNEKVKWLDGINNRVDSDFKTAFFNFDMELNNLEHTIDQSIRRESELSGIKQKSDSHFRNTVNTLEHVKDKVKNVNSLCENIENVYASAESSTFNFENTCSNIVSEMSFYQPNGFVRSYELFKTLFFNIDQNQVQLSNLIKAVSGLDVRDKLYDAIVYVYLQKLKSFKSSYDGFSRTKLLELTKKMHAKLEVIFVEAQKTLESEISKSKGSENEFRAIYEHFKIVNENIDYFIKGFDYVAKTLRSKFNIQEFDKAIKTVSTYKDTLQSSVRRAFFENAKSLFKDRYSDFFTTFNSLNTNTFEGQLVSLFSTIRNLNQDLKNYLELHRSFFNDKDFKNSVYKFLSSEFAGSISSTQTLVNTLFREMKDTYDARIKSEVSQFNNSSSRFFDNMNTNDAHLFFDRYVATYKSVNSNIASVKLSYDNSSKKCDEILKNINSEFGDVFGIKMNYSIGTLYNNYYNDMKQIVTSTILKVGTQTTALLRSLKNTLDGRINSYVNEFRNVSSSTWSTLKLENSIALADSYVSKYNYLNSQINSTLNSYEQVLKNFESIKSTVKNEFDCELKYDVTTLDNGYVKEITNITNSTLSNLGNSLTSLMVTLKNDYDNQIKAHVEGFRNVSLQFFDGMSWQNSSEFFDRYISTYNATYSQINRIIDLYNQAIQNIEKTKVKITNGFGYELKVRISSLDETFRNEIKDIYSNTLANAERMINVALKDSKDRTQATIKSYMKDFREMSLRFFDEMNMDNANKLFVSYTAEYNLLTTRITQTASSYEQNIAIVKGIAEKLKNVFGYDLKYQNYNLTSQYKEQANSIYNSAIERFERLLKSGIENLKEEILTMKGRYETDISSEQLESLDDFDEINIYLKKILALYSKFLGERMATSNVFLQKNNDIIHDAKLSKTIKDIDFNDINISEKLINDKIDLLYRYVENMIKTVKQDFDQVIDAMTRNNGTLIRDYNTKIVIDVRKFKEVYTKMRDATADFVKSPLRLNIKAQYTSYLRSISSAYSSFLKKAFALMNENLKSDCISLLDLYIGNLEDAKDLYNQIASILKEDGINLQPMAEDVNEYEKKFIDGCKERFFTHFVAETLKDAGILSYQEFEVQAKEKLKFYSENVEDIKSYYDKYLLDKFERIGAKCTIENCTAISDENIKNTIIKILNSCSGEHFAMIFNDKRISLFFKMHMLKLYFENINNDNKNFNDNKCFIINFLINNLKSKEVSILDKDKLRENISDESIDACNVPRMKKMGFRSFLGRGMTSGGVKHAFKNLSIWRKKNEKD